MSLTKERIYYLLKAHISEQASPAEESELMNWVLEAGEDSELKGYVLDLWNRHNASEDYSYVKWDEIYNHVVQARNATPEKKIRRMHWLKLMAAAVILITLSTGVYFFTRAPSSQPLVAKEITTTTVKQNDIAPPAGNKATITLADGTMIEIDSSGNGTLAVQGNVKIIKQSTGAISYAGSAAGVVSYNTLSVPRGSKPLSLLLSDGSQVWVNVGSSITYPTAFTGSERNVTITGEVYFEVAHNSRKPFVVQHDDVSIRVLGTHFNVNSYSDENSDRITLLEGSVRVDKGDRSQFLRPGQQASIDQGARRSIKVSNNVDIDEVMAWKNGKFRFNENTNLQTIMRQISRWYNVEIEYRGKINQHFWGSISKDVNVSQVLKILEATGGVKFKLEGNMIIVMVAAH